MLRAEILNCNIILSSLLSINSAITVRRFAVFTLPTTGCLLAPSDLSLLLTESWGSQPSPHFLPQSSYMPFNGKVNCLKTGQNYDFMTLPILHHKMFTCTGQGGYCLTISFHHKYECYKYIFWSPQLSNYLSICGGVGAGIFWKMWLRGLLLCSDHCASIPQGWVWAWSRKWVRRKCLEGFLVVQWLRIRLPMQGTRVQALVREDPTCWGAAKPMHNKYWACEPQLLKPAHLEPMLRKRSHRDEKPAHYNEE